MKKIISALTAITMTATLVVPTTLIMAQDEITVTVNGQDIYRRSCKCSGRKR